MAQVKGIIAEVDKNKCVIITRDGQFLKVNNPSRAIVGEEIEISQVSSSRMRLFSAMVAVLLLCLIIPSFNVLIASAKPVAYLSLDINPSLDLGIDKDGKVVSVKAFNSAGEKLINASSITKLKVDEAVQKLIEQAIKQGFINYSKTNLIVAAYTGGTTFTFNDNQIKTDVENQIKAADMEAEVVVVATDMNQHTEASKQQVSQGKYRVYEEAKAKGKNLTLQELKDKGINNTLIDNGVEVSDLIPGVAKIKMKAEQKGNGVKASDNLPKSNGGPEAKPGNAKGDNANSKKPGESQRESNKEWEHNSEDNNKKHEH
ncbi:MAG TPA: anti-sigma factor domain-containing protein [Candidatus Deferrimicrobium sp.]|nr:anti-sigma factor domain-containing protein [Candidatus Deferrimicrobium sp.]